MKILMNILTALGVILGIAFIGIYFLPDKYSLHQSIEIDKPVDLVYGQVSDYHKWNAWNPWSNQDAEAKYHIEGIPGTIGHKMSWESNKVGQGSLEIASVVTNELVEGDLQFIKPFKSSAKDKWQFENVGGKTRVVWTSEGKLSYPFGRLFGLSLDETVGKQQKEGLQKLKAVCESTAVPEQTSSASVGTKDMTSK